MYQASAKGRQSLQGGQLYTSQTHYMGTEQWLTHAERLMHVTARPAKSVVATFSMQPESQQAFHSVPPLQP